LGVGVNFGVRLYSRTNVSSVRSESAVVHFSDTNKFSSSRSPYHLLGTVNFMKISLFKSILHLFEDWGQRHFSYSVLRNIFK
jgi:hypothetical protein